MSIYLRAPQRDPRGPDGKGWNRLTVGPYTLDDQCALRPRSYSTLWESFDTRRAAWGGYGPCTRRGACDGCLTFERPAQHLDAFTDEVLVRIHPNTGAPHLMNKPEDGWDSYSKWWTWEDLARIDGWRIGDRYTDRHSDGFWLIRSGGDR